MPLTLTLLVLDARPKFADGLPDGTIDPSAIRKKITSRTKAVRITHVWGLPCEMDEVLDICELRSLSTLDASQALGTLTRVEKSGLFFT